ncbi:MAG: hypothetical protein JO056_03855 [Alphaproteobacteria bacterium]|nr:hypothetical protein [Alphaproteobacteria bacterium]
MTSRIAALLIGVSLVALAQAALADVEISNKATANMSCDAGVCTATAKQAVLNVAELQTMLGSGDVAVKTGTVANDISIDQPLTWASTSRLTLDAQASVTVNKPVTVIGQGGLTIATNDNGDPKSKSGEFVIVPERGSVQLWDKKSSLVIDGQKYKLVYNIKTLAAAIAANPSGFYALAKPYDASKDGTYTTAPIVDTFNGRVDGLGNTISNLTLHVSQGGAVGLFSVIRTGGAVRHLGIRNGIVSTQNSVGVGILAGNNESFVTRCWANGAITNFFATNIGGLMGANTGSLSHSFSNVKLHNTTLAGRRMGGLVGFNTGTVSASYALGVVSFKNGSENAVGGLVGLNEGAVSNVFARTRVADGNKSSGGYFGGLVGANSAGAQIETAYAAGDIHQNKGADDLIGGLVGHDGSNPGNISNTYWDLDKGISDPSQGAGNIANDPGITGLTDVQLKSGLPAGFDANIWASDPKINNGYPYLRSNPPR